MYIRKLPRCTELFGVSVSETMAARGLVNGRGPLRSSGRDSAKRVVSDTDTPKSSPRKVHRKNLPYLNCGKAVAVDFAVDVQGIDIGHAADIVQDCKCAIVDVFCVYVILT